MSYYARRALLLMTPSHSAPRTSKKRKEPQTSACDEPLDAPSAATATASSTTNGNKRDTTSNPMRFSQMHTSASRLSQSNHPSSNRFPTRKDTNPTEVIRMSRSGTNGTGTNVPKSSSQPMLLSQQDTSTVHTVTTQGSSHWNNHHSHMSQQETNQKQSSLKRSWISAALSVMQSHNSSTSTPGAHNPSKRYKGNHPDFRTDTAATAIATSTCSSEYSSWNHHGIQNNSKWILSQDQWNAMEEMMQSHAHSLKELQTKLLEPNNYLDERIQCQYDTLQKPVTQACHRAIQSSTLKLQKKIEMELEQIKYILHQHQENLQELQQQYNVLKQEHTKLTLEYRKHHDLCHQVMGDSSRTLSDKIQDVLNVTIPLLERSIVHKLSEKLQYQYHPSSQFLMHPNRVQHTSWNRNSLDATSTIDLSMTTTPVTPFPMAHWNPHFSFTSSGFQKNHSPFNHPVSQQVLSHPLQEMMHVTPMAIGNTTTTSDDIANHPNNAINTKDTKDATAACTDGMMEGLEGTTIKKYSDVFQEGHRHSDPFLQKKKKKKEKFSNDLMQQAEEKDFDGSNSSISSHSNSSSLSASNRMGLNANDTNRKNRQSNKENENGRNNIVDLLPCQVDHMEPKEKNEILNEDDRKDKQLVSRKTMPPVRARIANAEHVWNSRKPHSRVDSITKPSRRSSRLALQTQNSLSKKFTSSTNTATIVVATTNPPVTNKDSSIAVTQPVTVLKEKNTSKAVTVTVGSSNKPSKRTSKPIKVTPSLPNRDNTKKMSEMNDDDYRTPVTVERKNLAAPPKAGRISRRKKRCARSISPPGFQEQNCINDTTSGMELDLDDYKDLDENPPLMNNPNATVKNGLLLYEDKTSSDIDFSGTQMGKRLEVANIDGMPSPVLPDFDDVYYRFRSRRRKLVDPRLDGRIVGKDDECFSSGVFDFEA